MKITQGNDQAKNACLCNEVPVEEIVRYARNEPILVCYRLLELATLLGIPTENMTQFEKNGIIPDKLTFILQMWISRTGFSATVEAFITTLREMYLNDLAARLGQAFDSGMKIVNMRSCKCAQSSGNGQHLPQTPVQAFAYNNQQHFGTSSSTIYHVNQVAYQQQSAFASPVDDICGMFNQNSFQINSSSSDKVKFYLHNLPDQGSQERDMANVQRLVATTLPRDAVDELECCRVRPKESHWYTKWLPGKKENKVPAPLKVKMKTKKPKSNKGIRFNAKTVTAFMRQNPLCQTFGVKISENPDTTISSSEFDVEAQTAINYEHHASCFPNSYMQ